MLYSQTMEPNNSQVFLPAKYIHGNSVSCIQFSCRLFDIPHNFVVINAENKLTETEK